MSEIMEKLVESISEEKKIVLHMINGEPRIYEDIADLVEAAISATSPTFSYVSERNFTGEMYASVWVFGAVAVIKEEWYPAEGYCWSEKRITLLKLKSP